MKILKFLACLFLIYLVKGQTIDNGKSDCTKLMNFINGDSQDYANNCCTDTKGVICDEEGYITLYFNADELKIPDYSSFPYLSKIEGLKIISYGLTEIPNSIFSLTSLKLLDLSENNIGAIPTAIQNLSQLEELYLYKNNIKEVPNELYNLTNLKTIFLSQNHIEVISPDIQKLTNLEIFNYSINSIEVIPPEIQKLTKLKELVLNTNNIKKLPSEIFNLTNLNRLDLHTNQNLDAKIINFGNSTIQNCYFNSVNILCYEPNTCEKMQYNNKSLFDAEAQKYLKICTDEDKKEVLNQMDNSNNQNQNNEKSKTPYIVGGIILGVVVILIGIIVTFMLVRKNKSKRHNISDITNKDEFRNESIRVVLNDCKSNSDNANVVINNNNNNNNNNTNNNNDNSNNTQNNINQNNLNSNIMLNPNIILNQNGYNSNALTGMVVLINNPQMPSGIVTTGIPLYKNNNDQGINHGSISYDKNKMDVKKKAALISTSTDEEDEPPPEYSEINKPFEEQ